MFKVVGLTTMWSCNVPFKWQLMNDVLSYTVEKIRDNYILPSFVAFVTYITSFDFWMFCAGHKAFAMVVSFINVSWEFTCVTMGIFEVLNIIGATMEN
jgi:hypothetical protein